MKKLFLFIKKLKMNLKISLVLMFVFLFSCTGTDSPNLSEDLSIKKSGSVLYCDELEEGSIDQCEIRP